VPALPARAEASQTVDLVLARRRPLVSSSGARPLHRRGRARVGAARSRCRGAAALLPEAKQQPRPSDPVLAHLRADEWGASGAANTSRAAGGAWEQQSGVATPGRCNLESRRAPARHGTRGSPRLQQRPRATAPPGCGSETFPRLLRAEAGARSHDCRRGKGIAGSRPSGRSLSGWVSGKGGPSDAVNRIPV
jgi:hypothetical protein